MTSSQKATARVPAHCPPVLFKYMSAKRAHDFLRDLTVRWSSPLAFNDPFDGQWHPLWIYATPDFDVKLKAEAVRAFTQGIDWEQVPKGPHRDRLGKLRIAWASQSRAERDLALEELLGQIRPEEIANSPAVASRFRDIAAAWRVWCLTEDPLSILMWSHYGDSHAGVVVAFDVAALVKHFALAPERVRYSTDLPSLSTPDAYARTLMYGGPPPFDTREAGKLITLTKAEAWRYEAEWRFVARSTEPSRHTIRTVSPSCVHALYFGASATSADMTRIKRLTQTNRFRHVKSFAMSRNSVSFRLDVAPIPA